MKLLLLLALIVVSTIYASSPFDDITETEMEDQFLEWIQVHGKQYPHDEFHYRFRVWKSNLKFVVENNARPDVTYTVSMNKFADLTVNEFVERYTGAKQIVEMTPEDLKAAGKPLDSLVSLPTTVDWRTAGVVTPVKDQGQCGSCWAFSTTGAVEGVWALKSGKLVSLSEQQLVDCNTNNSGCNGGWPYIAMQYLIGAGSDTESSYPYHASQGRCVRQQVGAKVVGYYQLPKGSESNLQSATANVGPVSVCIDASQPSFQLYKSGVYNEPKCNPYYLDHAVLVVGYGNEGGKDYWLVKNSWGTSWGEQGYIKMSRNANNQCGIASAAVYAMV
eukprot:TRINITY_DN179_c0_g1_i1.p1 TRINITY_DN179_c0_g1~~TRINITY_DN179_c0_g1_i1.p1  ORF type:complete len:332 (+),score=98.75 TRINITY_DN179_c0_g1_i1:51-1046(+)